MLATRIQQYPSPEGVLLNKKKESKKNKSSEKRSSGKSGHKKKVKSSKHNKEVDLMLPELAVNDVEGTQLIETGEGNSNKMALDIAANDKPREKVKTEKHKKSKKESKDKESKKNKTSKKGIFM